MKFGVIRTKIYFLGWMICLSVLSACQPDVDECLELAAPVNVVVSTRATTEDDASVSRLRFVVTGYNADGTGTVSYNQLVESPGTATGFKIQAREGDNNFYLIANESPELTTALNGLKTAADLEQFKVNFQPLKAGESPVMFGAMRKVKVEAATTNLTDMTGKMTYTDESGATHTGVDKLPMTLVRTYARFSLIFIKNSDAFTVKDLNFKVLRIPTYFRLGTPEAYPGTVWSKETLPQSSTATLTTNNTATWNDAKNPNEYTYGSGDKVVFDDFYLPEHLLTDAHRGDADFTTALIVNGTCVMPGGRLQDANWRIDLMTNNFSIKRNTHYKIAASISGMGAMGMSTEVMPVEQHDIPVNWGTPDGLAVVSNRTADYGKDVNIANDVTAYSGILKVVKNIGGKAVYNDVLFKYGSIVGISATAGTSGNGYNAATDVSYDPALTDKTYSVSSWAGIPTSTSDIASVSNNLAGLRAGTGDPCQLIGVTARQMEQGRYTNGLWHTATAEELTRLIDNGDNRIDGTSTTDSRGFLTFHQLLLPVSAHRDNTGSLVAATNWGYYLSGTIGKVLSFDASAPVSAGMADFSANAQSAYTVRCVRNTIPATVFNTTTSTLSYQGGDFTIDVKSNAPYWTAELMSAPSGVTFAKTTGAFNGTVSGNVAARKETSDRSFIVRIKGTGYDGVTETRDVQVAQRGFTWKLSIVSNTLPGTIPKTGGTYTAVMRLEPTDVNLPAGITCTLAMQINGVNQSGVQTQPIDAVTRQAEFTYTVPANDTDVSRMMSFVFKASVSSSSSTVNSNAMQSK